MKIARKDQRTLLYLIGLLMVIAVYFLFYTNKQKEITDMEAEVEQLEAQVRELEDYELNSQTYKDNTKAYYQEIDDMVGQFPGGILEEDIIMYGRNLETQLGMNVSNIAMSPSALLSSFGIGERQKHLYTSAVTVNFTGTYDMVKSMITDIQNNKDKRNITSLSLNYNRETGNLTGQATLNLYSLSGKDRNYMEPSTGVTNHGTVNVFGQ